MPTAGEIRKKVREAERERVKAREQAAVSVAQAYEHTAAARAALADSEVSLRTAVTEAIQRHGFTATELTTLTGVPRAAMRPSAASGKQRQPEKSTASKDGTTSTGTTATRQQPAQP